MCCDWVVYFRKIKTSLLSICWRSMVLLSTPRACLIVKLNVFTSTRGNYWTVCISLLFIIVRAWFLFTESVLPSSLSLHPLSSPLSLSLSLSLFLLRNEEQSWQVLSPTYSIDWRKGVVSCTCTGVQRDIVLIILHYYILFLHYRLLLVTMQLNWSYNLLTM